MEQPEQPDGGGPLTGVITASARGTVTRPAETGTDEAGGDNSDG